MLQPPSPARPYSPPSPQLVRHFGTLQATALNMSNMVGIGPFITIPILMSALAGPHSMLGWIVALLIVIPDGLIWSELGAAMPGSGGSYRYLRDGFGSQTFGRLMAFLFIWQFIVSGPMEIATGYIGFARYLRYLWNGMTPTQVIAVAVIVGIANIALLYRQITHIGKITVALWAGTLITTLLVIAAGAFKFDSKLAFDFPPDAFQFNLGFLFGLGTASRIGVYDYLGYYDICYIGDEVKNPGRTIPRSIVLSVIAVALIYFGINLSIIGVLPWREFVPAAGNAKADFVVSLFMERILGSTAASVFTLLVLWTAFGSCFALLLGYSRIPFAAAQDGYFFKVFGKLHPTKRFPHVSLVAMGAVAIFFSFFDLGLVIDALIGTRILVQFIAQIAALVLLRKRAPGLERPYRLWLYPVPLFVALAGWIFIYVTLDATIILFSLGALLLGIAAFLAWSAWSRTWPFQKISDRH